MAISPSVLWGCLLADLNDFSSVFGLYPDSPFRLGEFGRPFGHCAKVFAADALLRSAIKKCTDGADAALCEAAAVAQFVEINEQFLSRKNVVDVSRLGPYDEVILGEFKRSLYNFWTPNGYPLLDHGAIASYVDHGPGTSPGVKETSFYHKTGDSALCAPNPLLVEFYYEWVKGSEVRIDCEIARLLHHGPISVRDTSSISFVPKTTEPPMARAVTPEPPIGMFFQKGIQELIEKRLYTHFGIDLSTQPAYNQALARIGSLTGEYATLDLSSASDRISWAFCREFLPRQDFFWLNATRTPNAELPNGQRVELSMMATMGNAWCFPLQTVIFCCMVEAVYRALGLPFNTHHTRVLYQRAVEDDGRWSFEIDRRDAKNWGVFGDDIIVHRDAFAPLCRLLVALGMKPNETKSFNSGPFRESCGADYYTGTNVRGVYIKSLKTPQDVAVAYNSFLDWSACHEIPLKRTLSLLRGEGGYCLNPSKDSLPKVSIPLVPPWEQPDAGFRVPLGIAAQQGCVWLGRKLKPDAVCSSLSGSFLYNRFAPEPRRLNVEKKSRETDQIVPNPKLNGAAVLMSAVRSKLRGGWITLRSWVPTYFKGKATCPSWDWYPNLDPRFETEAKKNVWIKTSEEGWPD